MEHFNNRDPTVVGELLGDDTTSSGGSSRQNQNENQHGNGNQKDENQGDSGDMESEVAYTYRDDTGDGDGNDANANDEEDNIGHNIMADCSVYFPLGQVFGDGADTSEPNTATGSTLIGVADSEARVVTSAAYLLDETRTNPHRPICAVLGGIHDGPALELSTTAAGMGVPYLTHSNQEPVLLGSPKYHPLAAGVSVSLHPMGEAIVSALRNMGRSDYLSILDTSNNDRFSETLDNAAKESGMTAVRHHKISPPFTGWEPNRGIGYALSSRRSKI